MENECTAKSNQMNEGETKKLNLVFLLITVAEKDKTKMINYLKQMLKFKFLLIIISCNPSVY